MKVLCCYTNMHPATQQSLANYARADLVNVTGDRFGYWRAIAERWHDGLITIEQDIEIGPDTIAELENCPEDWCTFRYRIYTLLLNVGLGCTKFSARVQEQVSWRDIADHFLDCFWCEDRAHGCWHTLDFAIKFALRDKGFKPHLHDEITHHHDYRRPPPDKYGLINGMVPMELGMLMFDDECDGVYDIQELKERMFG